MATNLTPGTAMLAIKMIRAMSQAPVSCELQHATHDGAVGAMADHFGVHHR